MIIATVYQAKFIFDIKLYLLLFLSCVLIDIQVRRISISRAKALISTVCVCSTVAAAAHLVDSEPVTFVQSDFVMESDRVENTYRALDP